MQRGHADSQPCALEHAAGDCQAAFFAGLQRLGAARTSMLSTLEPIVTVALAVLLLGEALSVAQCLGGALILGAVLWLVRAR
jgi:drug/metabolite transporter (DMT)-like permease